MSQTACPTILPTTLLTARQRFSPLDFNPFDGIKPHFMIQPVISLPPRSITPPLQILIAFHVRLDQMHCNTASYAPSILYQPDMQIAVPTTKLIYPPTVLTIPIVTTPAFRYPTTVVVTMTITVASHHSSTSICSPSSVPHASANTSLNSLPKSLTMATPSTFKVSHWSVADAALPTPTLILAHRTTRMLRPYHPMTVINPPLINPLSSMKLQSFIAQASSMVTTTMTHPT